MNGDEKSIIDFAIVCQEMFSLFKCMKIDPDNAFTNYSKKTIKKSDHHLLVCSFEINFSQNKIEQKKRKTVFNFRSSEGWEKYKEVSIFCLSKARSVMHKLIYQDIYKKVDKNMSYSNAGGRKGRGSRDQLFILYGIINDVINGESCSINLMSMDVSLCFDKLDFSETNNDLWDVKVTDDKFALLAKLDGNVRQRLKLPVGNLILSLPLT